MFTRFLCIVMIMATALTAAPPPTQAQFGFRKVFRAVPKVFSPRRGGLGIIPAVPLLGGGFRGALGIVAAVAIGGVILNRLSKTERREVSRRARVVVAKDPDKRVEDSYSTKDGSKLVTITAEPATKLANLKDDPAFKPTQDKIVVADGGPNKTAPPGGSVPVADNKPATPPATPPATANPADQMKPSGDATAAVKSDNKSAAPTPVVDKEAVKIADLPADTQCRKVITNLEIKKAKKGDKVGDKSTNTAIFCQTAPGEWKPASA